MPVHQRLTVTLNRILTIIKNESVLLFLLILSGEVRAQLEFVPPISVKMKENKCIEGLFLIDTRDFHVEYGAPNSYPSTLQIINPLNPWPPIFFANAAPGGKGLLGNGIYQNFHFHETTRQFSFYTTATTGNPYGQFIICDTNLNILDTVTGLNNNIDGHEFEINSGYERLCLIVFDTIIDIFRYTGIEEDTSALITSQLIVIVNQNDSILFSWNPHEHLSLTDSYLKFHDSKNNNPFTKGWDWQHANSVRFAIDGNILYSFKYIGVGKINRQTGEVMWKFGGKSPTIQVPNGGGYYRQHDFHEVSPGVYSLYSNGDKIKQKSRTLTYRIDEESFTAEIARVYEPDSPVLSIGFGNYETEQNGICLFNYGKYLNLGERQRIFEILDTTGKVYAEYSSPALNFTYRVQRVRSWKLTQPTIINKSGTLNVSGFAYSVMWYRLYGTKLVLASEELTYQPKEKGIYVAVSKAGFGWLVSKPYVF